MRYPPKYYTDTEYRVGNAVWKYIFAKDFDKITVTQICQEAEISRDTFYRHFSTPIDVIIDCTVTAAKEGFNSYADINSFFDYQKALSKNWFPYGDYLLPLIHFNLTYVVVDLMYDFFKEKGFFEPILSRTDLSDVHKEYMLNAFTNAYIQINIDWAKENYITSKKEIFALQNILYKKLICTK